MKISWTSLKVSVAGAKLSHLVQKDSIWDHGSMIEQVKIIFYQLEKAKNKRETDGVKKYLTTNAFEKLKMEIEASRTTRSFFKDSVLTEISIVQVSRAKKEKPDGFTALIKGKRKLRDELIVLEKKNYGVENFYEKWKFVRHGDWWLLDGIAS
jgi:predicted lipid-binding transport protein (Tim44 family)